MRNLLDDVGPELLKLADDLFECFDNTRTRTLALEAAEYFDERLVIQSIDFHDREYLKKYCLLAPASDCLRAIVNSILADGQVEQHELDVAYSIVRPIAELYASFFSGLYRYRRLERDLLPDFLHEFLTDNGHFGGGPHCPTPHLGAISSCVASIANKDGRILDIYIRIVETTMRGIVGLHGKRQEVNLIEVASRFHRTLRECVDTNSRTRHEYNNNVVGNSSTKPSGMAPASFASSKTTTLDNSAKKASNNDALEQASADLQAMIGLPGVKQDINKLISFLTIQEQRRKHGLKSSNQSLHYIFTGNPGTGKTTVARILARIFYGYGVLKQDKLVECDRSKLVGGYVGQTAIKTDEVIQSAIDGLLFIDEAYTLAGDASKYGHADMYGEEAINTLLKRMEDDRERLIVIAAGYPELMVRFLHSNPGLESRFTRFIHFEDYSVPDLCRIFDKFCNDTEYSLTAMARAYAYTLFAIAHSRRNDRFGNARFIRNVFENAVSIHSNRLTSGKQDIDKNSLVSLDYQDIPFAMINDIDVSTLDLAQSRWEAGCPGCGKSSKAGINYLGNRVNCKCGRKFIFPWWNPIPETIKGISTHYFVPSQEADKLGTSG